MASRIVEGAPPADVVYSPWLTANLTLDRWPREAAFPPAWDNVIFDSPALGYVVATHQQLRRHVPRTVWTYYWALADATPAAARAWLLARTGGRCGTASSRTRRARIPTSRECVSRVDIMAHRPRDGPADAGVPVVPRASDAPGRHATRGCSSRTPT